MNRARALRYRSFCGRLLIVAIGAAQACAPSVESKQTHPPTETASPAAGDKNMALTIRSSAFANQARIPKRFTGDGEDVSPELLWSGAGAGTKELAMICDDPDAPTPQPWVHWVLYKIPATATGLRENIPKAGSLSEPAGALQGVNSWSEIGYRGPAPPHGHGVHHYHFKLYALDTALTVVAGTDKNTLLAAMEGHILGQAEWVGTYER